MKEISLKIEGMHCTGCSNRLEKVLNNTDGVEKATVSFEDKKAIITFDESKTENKYRLSVPLCSQVSHIT